MEQAQRHTVMRFVLPVTLETIGTVLIGMVFSALIGGISASALPAISTANLVITIYTALFSLLSVGAAVLTARLVGARETAEASRTIEQIISMTVLFSLLLTVVSLALALPIMRLLMPTAEQQLMDEAVVYFRVTSLGILPLMLYTVLVSVLRASGNSRAPFIITTVQNLCQILFAFLFIRLLPLDIVGAALAMVLCRLVGGVLSVVTVFRSHSVFYIRPQNLLKPHMPTIKRIMRIGWPATFESVFVQMGYLIANSLVVSLGTQQANVYQVANALQSFANIPNSITSAVATTFVGQYIGAKEYARAKKFGYVTFLISVPISLALYVVIALLSPWLAPLYSSDASVISATVTCLWVLMAYALPALSINTLDPALKVGGDVKFVMLETLLGVWVFRLPLSWLLGHRLGYGVIGIYWANIISLCVRALCGQLRFRTGKWMYKRV